MARFANRDRIIAALKKLPAEIKAAVGEQVMKEAEGLAQAIQRAAPVGVSPEPHPGELKASVHAVKDQKRELAARVVVDAKDERGRPYAKHVEFGHMNHGQHVPPVPFAYPTKRAMARGIKRRINKAGRDAARRFAAANPGIEYK